MLRRAWVIAALAVLMAPPAGLATGPVAARAAADGFALPAFGDLWARADQAVAAGELQRTWLWGPGPIAAGRVEPYADAPGGGRLVQYFDKSRMEDNAWRAGDDPLWRVTNGLLVVELVSGRLQVGDAQTEARAPAAVSMAGDPGGGPTYADLAGLLTRPAPPGGAVITDQLQPGGRVVEGAPPPVEVRVGPPVPGASRTIAAPFWEFMRGPGAVEGNPFFATGLPIAGPVWSQVRVGGQPRWVLLQAFERRVLTYTPGNPAGFTVEMGNVGRHYYEWRYGGPPVAPPRPPVGEPGPLQPVPLAIPEALRSRVAADRLQRFANRQVNLPPGLSISLYTVLAGPRFMGISPAGDLYVAEPWQGRVVALPDRDRDGVADEQIVVATDLNVPHSLAFHDGGLYVAESHRIIRLDDQDGDRRADRTTVIVPDLPNRGQHWSRTIVFGPDGKLYVSVGSSCNVCVEQDWRRAAILQYNADGSGGRVYARGLRNSVGLAWQPGSGRLYASENGRDHLGDDEPPEEINEIRDGADYGWPRCHGADRRDPRFGQAADACAGQTPPVVLMQAHSAPLGIAFVERAAFPVAYHGDLLVAFHGSWNRSVPTGYKVVRLPVREGRPTGLVEDFLTGFQTGTGAWSRPVGLVFGPDGALYVSDDAGGAIFRVTYAASGA